MQKIEVKSGFIYFYGNPAGYIEEDKAIIDPIFKSDEFSEWLAEKKGLEPEWRSGVFDRLSAVKPDTATGETKRYKDCRIWQLKPEADPLIKYIGYDELLSTTGRAPDPADYTVALDFQPNTDDLDKICEMFDEHPHSALTGQKINLSDVIELYDKSGSEFNYVDRRGFAEVDFKPGQELTQAETQNGEIVSVKPLPELRQ